MGERGPESPDWASLDSNILGVIAVFLSPEVGAIQCVCKPWREAIDPAVYLRLLRGVAPAEAEKLVEVRRGHVDVLRMFETGQRYGERGSENAHTGAPVVLWDTVRDLTLLQRRAIGHSADQESL